MAKYLLMAVLSCLGLPSAIFAQPVAPSGYDIAWSDEFDGTVLDTSRWTASSNSDGGGNQSLQHYLPEMVTVADGKLVITSNDIPTALKPYRSGLIETNNYQKYGRWDVRAKLPGTKGTWPAIWLLSNNAVFPWPSRGEIDIMENRGNEPQTTSSAFHFGTNPPYAPQFVYANQSQVQNGTKVNYHTSGFHTFSTEWDPDQIRFYVDDVHHYTVRDSNVDGFLTGTGQYAGGGVGEMRLIINTAIGGTFLPNPDETSVWPQTHEVDYVHAYTKSASPPVLTLDNGGFEDQGGSLAHWSTFGVGGFNVSTIDGPTGGKAMKVYGQFNGNTNYSGVEQGISVTAGDEIRASADAFVSASDSLIGTSNQLELKIDYYNKLYGQFGSSEYISSDSIILANAGSPTNQWFNDEILSTAPAGTVEARVAIVFRQVANAGGSVYIDNVYLALDAVAATVAADTLTVDRGNQTGGTLAETTESDDSYVSFQPGLTLNANEAPVRLIFDGILPSDSPNTLDLVLESSAVTGGMFSTTLEAWNWGNNEYDVVDVSPASVGSDNVTTVDLNSDYVQSGTGAVRSRVGWRLTGFAAQFPWEVQLDQLVWKVNQ